MRAKRSEAPHREMYGILGTESGVLVPDVVGKIEMGTESSYSVPISMDVIPRFRVAG